MRSIVLFSLVAAFWLGVCRCDAQTAKIQKQIEKKLDKARADQKKDSIWMDLAAGPGTSTLDQLIAEALKNNPDIRVAEAKLRETEVETARMRLKVAVELAAHHAEMEAARGDVEEAKKRYERTKALYESKATSAEELQGALISFEKMKRELSAKDVKLSYLLGRPIRAASSALIDDFIKKKWLEPIKDTAVTDDEFLRRVMIDSLGRLPTAEERQKFMSLPEKTRRKQWFDQMIPVDSMSPARTSVSDRVWVEKYWEFYFSRAVALSPSPWTDKLRKALDTPARLEFNGALPEELMDHLQKTMLPGINLHLRAKAAKKEPIDVKLTEPVPVGAILQYLEDEMKVVFILRDYGIVVVSADERLPPGATRVLDYWKHGKKSETAPDKEEKSKPAPGEKSKAPPKSVRGAIENVDEKDPLLVQISLGSNDGLEKGATLEAFRLQPQPRYLGRIRVVEVHASRAVARMFGTNMDPLSNPRAGDQVASQLPAK